LVRLLTIRDVADRLGLAESSVRARLCRHRALFPPRYRRHSRHPRRLRVLTDSELHLLAFLVASAPLKRKDVAQWR
jgi:hypothetical protein